MKPLSFYHACQLFLEAPAPPADPMGGAPPMPGGDPGALGGPPGGDPGAMGGPPGGLDPMGGGGAPPAPATPVPIRTIPIADVWKVLRRVADNPQYDEFFNEINVGRLNPKLKKVNKEDKVPKSLLK